MSYQNSNYEPKDFNEEVKKIMNETLRYVAGIISHDFN